MASTLAASIVVMAGACGAPPPVHRLGRVASTVPTTTISGPAGTTWGSDTAAPEPRPDVKPARQPWKALDR